MKDAGARPAPGPIPRVPQGRHATFLLLLASCILHPSSLAQEPVAEPPAAPVITSPRAPRLAPPHSLSTSKQFIIYAEDGALRAAIGLVGEEVREGLGRLLGPEVVNGWRVPIVVDLRRPPAGLPGEVPPSRLTLGQTGAGLKIQLELLLGESSRGVHLREELVRALLLEIAYRNAPDLPAGRAFRLPPPWLVEGCGAWLEARADDIGPVKDTLFAALAAPRAALPVADFLSKDPEEMDSTSRTLYRADAYGLLRLLTEETKNGREAVVGQLRELPEGAPGPDPGPGPVLARVLPEIVAAPGGLEKWWTAGRFRLAAVQRAVAVLGVEESERELAALLSVTIPGETEKNGAGSSPAAGRVYRIEECEKYLSRDGGKRGRQENERRLAPVRAGLMAVGARMHPFYRGIVAGYEAAVAHLGRGDVARAEALLQTLAAERAQARTRHEAISDYLNWFEATQPSLPSGTFEPYFRAARKSEADLQRRGRRTDPISTYLDAMEAEF